MDLHVRRTKKVLSLLNTISDRHCFLKKIIEKINSVLENKFLTEFFKNISMIFIFKVITQVIITIMTIIAARELGPVSMGDIAIISNIANFLNIPLIMGVSISMNKYLPVLDEKSQKEMISSTMLSSIPLSFVLLAVYYLLSGMICKSFNITYSFMVNSLILCALTTYSIISESFLRGQKKYKQICFLKLAFSILFSAGLFVQFYVIGSKNINSYLNVNYMAYIIFIAGAILLTGARRLIFNLKAVKSVYSYGFINMLGAALNIILTSSDLFFVKSFCTPYETGIYSVYMGNTKNLLGLLFYEIVSVVFLPTIASMDKQIVYKKITRYCIPIFAAVFLMSVAWSSFAILMYGNQYQYNLLYIVLASASSGVTFIFQLYSFTIAMEGKKEARFTLMTGALPLPLVIFIQYAFTKYIGLIGTFTAILIINLILLVTLLISVHWYRNRKNFVKAGL